MVLKKVLRTHRSFLLHIYISSSLELVFRLLGYTAAYFYFSYGHFMSLQAEERSFEWNLEESRGVEGVALNDVEEARGGCLLVLRHNLLVFITDDARKLLSSSLSSSTAILRHLYFRRLALFLRFCP